MADEIRNNVGDKLLANEKAIEDRRHKKAQAADAALKLAAKAKIWSGTSPNVGQLEFSAVIWELTSLTS